MPHGGGSARRRAPREHGRACGIENGPLIRIRKRWNRDILAPVEADEGGIHQLVNFHHAGRLFTSLPERSQISVRVAAGSTAWT